MRLVRYFIVLVSVGWLAFIVYSIADEERHGGHGHVPLWAYLIPASILVNLVYVWFSRPRNDRQSNRIARMLSLWLDAKEAELQERAKHKN
jgi:hypothetical protein